MYYIYLKLYATMSYITQITYDKHFLHKCDSYLVRIDGRNEVSYSYDRGSSLWLVQRGAMLFSVMTMLGK